MKKLYFLSLLLFPVVCTSSSSNTTDLRGTPYKQLLLTNDTAEPSAVILHYGNSNIENMMHHMRSNQNTNKDSFIQNIAHALQNMSRSAEELQENQHNSNTNWDNQQRTHSESLLGHIALFSKHNTQPETKKFVSEICTKMKLANQQELDKRQKEVAAQNAFLDEIINAK